MFGEPLAAEAADLPELVDAVERAVLGAVVDDALGERRADAGQLFEVFDGRQVQVDGLAPRPFLPLPLP